MANISLRSNLLDDERLKNIQEFLGIDDTATALRFSLKKAQEFIKSTHAPVIRNTVINPPRPVKGVEYGFPFTPKPVKGPNDGVDVGKGEEIVIE